jgi:hypothetical protein
MSLLWLSQAVVFVAVHRERLSQSYASANHYVTNRNAFSITFLSLFALYQPLGTSSSIGMSLISLVLAWVSDWFWCVYSFFIGFASGTPLHDALNSRRARENGPR